MALAIRTEQIGQILLLQRGTTIFIGYEERRVWLRETIYFLRCKSKLNSRTNSASNLYSVIPHAS